MELILPILITTVSLFGFFMVVVFFYVCAAYGGGQKGALSSYEHAAGNLDNHALYLTIWGVLASK